MKRRLTALLLVLLCLPLTACQKQQNLYSATWFDLFDTVAIVQGYADSQDSWNAQTQAMYSDLQRYNEFLTSTTTMMASASGGAGESLSRASCHRRSTAPAAMFVAPLAAG